MRFPLASLVLVSLAVFNSGCTPADPPQRTEANVEDRLMALSLAYGRAATPPANEAEFRKAVEDFSQKEAAAFQGFHLKSVDEAFTSPRDGQPFGLRYNVKPGAPGLSQDVIAYETSSQGGKRFVALAGMQVIEVDDAKFQELVKE